MVGSFLTETSYGRYHVRAHCGLKPDDDILELHDEEIVVVQSEPDQSCADKLRHHPSFFDEGLALACLVTAFLIWPWSYLGSLVLFVCAMAFFLSANSQSQ